MRFIDLNIDSHLLFLAHRPVLCTDMSLPHIRIKRAAFQEFLLLSAINNLSFLQNDNLICVLNGRQTVCNHQQGLSFGKGHDGFLDFIFILRVSEGSCLVQNHNRRIFQDCSRNSNSLLFSAGEPLASITGWGIIKCGAAQFDALDKSDIIMYRKMDYEWQVLISDRTAMQKKYPKAMIVPATIDEIMLLYVKGEK